VLFLRDHQIFLIFSLFVGTLLRDVTMDGAARQRATMRTVPHVRSDLRHGFFGPRWQGAAISLRSQQDSLIMIRRLMDVDQKCDTGGDCSFV
jgi:hypothetical protein